MATSLRTTVEHADAPQMRRVVLFLLAAPLLLVIGSRLLTPSAPEGPTRVVTGAPVQVVLPVAASVDTITARINKALDDAIARADSTFYRVELEELRADQRSVESMATTGQARFASGDAGALAYPRFSVTAGARVTIIAYTVELLPGRRSLAIAKDHEDGHAEVNNQLGLRCGPSLVDAYVDDGLRGARLEIAVARDLQSLADAAHDVYHLYVKEAALGQHLRLAKQAATEVATGDCTAT